METYIPRRDICFSLAEGVTRYVESVPRSRLVARTLKSRSQSILTCKHDGHIDIGFSLFVLLVSKTNHAFDVGRDSKSSQNELKMGGNDKRYILFLFVFNYFLEPLN